MVKGLPIGDRLDGASKYGSWKPRVFLYLEENEVKEFALKIVPIIDDATQLEAWKRNDVKDLLAPKNVCRLWQGHQGGLRVSPDPLGLIGEACIPPLRAKLWPSVCFWLKSLANSLAIH